jgi:hypothetical protein
MILSDEAGGILMAIIEKELQLPRPVPANARRAWVPIQPKQDDVYYSRRPKSESRDIIRGQE